MSEDINTMSAQLDQLVSSITSITVKEVDMSEAVDQELLDWYESRFKMLTEDGVPSAITPYLEKVATESANDRTKATILQMALEKYFMR